MDLIYSFFAVKSEGRVMESSRFRFPKSTEQERSILIDSIPKKNTRQNTKWAAKVFEGWQHAGKTKDAIKEMLASDKWISHNPTCGMQNRTHVERNVEFLAH